MIVENEAIHPEPRPITGSVRELARRIRTDLLRSGGYDWDDREIVGALGSGEPRVCEPAVIASFVIIGRLAQDRGHLRTASRAFWLAEWALFHSARFGRFQRKSDAVERAHAEPSASQFIPIVRSRDHVSRLPRGQHYAVPDAGGYKILKRNVAA